MIKENVNQTGTPAERVGGLPSARRMLDGYLVDALRSGSVPDPLRALRDHVRSAMQPGQPSKASGTQFPSIREVAAYAAEAAQQAPYQPGADRNIGAWLRETAARSSSGRRPRPQR